MLFSHDTVKSTVCYRHTPIQLSHTVRSLYVTHSHDVPSRHRTIHCLLSSHSHTTVTHSQKPVTHSHDVHSRHRTIHCLLSSHSHTTDISINITIILFILVINSSDKKYLFTFTLVLNRITVTCIVSYQWQMFNNKATFQFLTIILIIWDGMHLPEPQLLRKNFESQTHPELITINIALKVRSSKVDC